MAKKKRVKWYGLNSGETRTEQLKLSEFEKESDKP